METQIIKLEAQIPSQGESASRVTEEMERLTLGQVLFTYLEPESSHISHRSLSLPVRKNFKKMLSLCSQELLLNKKARRFLSGGRLLHKCDKAINQPGGEP